MLSIYDSEIGSYEQRRAFDLLTNSSDMQQHLKFISKLILLYQIARYVAYIIWI